MLDIIERHPNFYLNGDDVPVIPAEHVVDVFREFSDIYDGTELLSPKEIDDLKKFLDDHPGLEATPGMLLGLIAARTPASGHSNEQLDEDALDEHEVDDDLTWHNSRRGRDSNRSSPQRGARDSSNESAGGTQWTSGRRGSVDIEGTPSSSKSSVFDTTKRQRSTPLSEQNTAPSSWAKRPAPSRKRRGSGASDRAMSDSEVCIVTVHRWHNY